MSLPEQQKIKKKKSSYFEFNGKVKKQTSGTAIGTKFTPPQACIFMDQVKTEFLETQKHKPLVWCNETELKPYAFAFQEIQSQLGP